MSTATVIAIVVAVVAIAFAGWMYLQWQRTRKLRSQFGVEYDRVVREEHGNARRAEALLEQRRKRVSRFRIRSLTREESAQFTSEWRSIQESFVDDPLAAIGRADQLITDTLRLRGYPMSDFDQLAADISVEHPEIVSEYRYAHAVTLSAARNETSTEDLRKAMQHYRNLFEHVLEAHAVA